jgi:hypothetical protein
VAPAPALLNHCKATARSGRERWCELFWKSSDDAQRLSAWRGHLCGNRACLPCHRQVGPDPALAVGHIASQEPRHALWRLREVQQSWQTCPTKGFLIQVFGAGENVPAFQVFDASNHTVEMGNSGSYYYIGKNLAFGTAVPFGLH